MPRKIQFLTIFSYSLRSYHYRLISLRNYTLNKIWRREKMVNRREFLKLSAAGAAAFYTSTYLKPLQRAYAAPIAGGTLDPTLVAKYVAPLVKPPFLKRDGKIKISKGKNAEYYAIAVKQFNQQILPAGSPTTKVWSYGPANKAPTLANSYFYPAFTMENKYNKPTVVKWVNGLVDASGGYLPHILPVDQTLHWANPPGPRDLLLKTATDTQRPGTYLLPIIYPGTSSIQRAPSTIILILNMVTIGHPAQLPSHIPTTSQPQRFGTTTTLSA
jgi:hypothetical protein